MHILHIVFLNTYNRLTYFLVWLIVTVLLVTCVIYMNCNHVELLRNFYLFEYGL